jgi:hypothetical protein
MESQVNRLRDRLSPSPSQPVDREEGKQLELTRFPPTGKVSLRCGQIPFEGAIGDAGPPRPSPHFRSACPPCEGSSLWYGLQDNYGNLQHTKAWSGLDQR